MPQNKIILTLLFVNVCFVCAFAAPPGVVVPAGKEFEEKSQDLIERLEKFLAQEGEYASATGEARFKDIGLNPNDWDNKDFEGIIYNPKGTTLEVRPAEGYTFFVKTTRGVTRILSSDLGWSLIYNLSDKIWYFYRINPENALDIATLKVKKDTPYNPDDYRDDSLSSNGR